jgi:hypothetical protein
MKKITILLLFFYSVSQAQLELPYAVKNVNNRPIDHWYYNPATLAPWANTAAILASATRIEGQLYYVAGGDIYTFKGGILDANLLPISASGGGDMVLAGTQTNTGLKTFLNGTLGMRNVANTFTSTFTNTNTAARTYTLPDVTGTVLLTNTFGTPNPVTNFYIATTQSNSSGFQFENLNAAGDFSTFVSGGKSFVRSNTSSAMEIISISNVEVSNTVPALSFAGMSSRLGVAEYASQNIWNFYLEALADNSNIGSMTFTDNRTIKKGIEYAASYAGILANDRSIPDIGTIKSGAFTSTGKKTFSVAGNIAGINVGANATDPTTALAAGDVYYQTGVGLRVYSGSDWGNVLVNSVLPNVTDQDFTATLNRIHNILDGVATANRVITIPTGANGDILKFFNTEDNFTWTFAGETVYLADRVTVVTQLLFNVPCLMERIDGRWIITN